MCYFWRVSFKEGRCVCPSSFLLAGLQCDSRCLSSQPGSRDRKSWIQDAGTAKQKKTLSHPEAAATPDLHTSFTWWEIKFCLAWGTGIWGALVLWFWFWFLSLTAKPNPNWFFPVSITYAFSIHCDIRTAPFFMWKATYEWGLDSSVIPIRVPKSHSHPTEWLLPTVRHQKGHLPDRKRNPFLSNQEQNLFVYLT